MRIFLAGLEAQTASLQGLPALDAVIDSAAALMTDASRQSGKITLCGNGGSFAGQWEVRIVNSGDVTARIDEAHILAGRSPCAEIEERLRLV